jgi:hypothetical protein
MYHLLSGEIDAASSGNVSIKKYFFSLLTFISWVSSIYHAGLWSVVKVKKATFV